ncbi:LytR/AlgR family response regulator transcription factor [Dyadobacter bucti]|uniref:LytR/AlgR family response regulator transcription factor n=1 Tax=Dyadobacter bucti TaxID=2572203 RepID=UPI00110840C7|nr:LytTR family DNA-binding domain-containing protein [Dyadobacter bucti]
MRILIIEDETKTGKELKRQLEALNDTLEILSILPSIKSAVKWFSENQLPDLIFADIQLADGLSFEIFKQLKIQAPVIFCTAYDEYAIRAFEADSIDYLLKPVDENKLEFSLAKYERMKGLFTNSKEDSSKVSGLEKRFEQMLSKFDTAAYKTTILVHFQEKIIPVKTSEILYIHYENGLVSICLSGNQKYITTHTLDDLEGMLNPVDFFRANRQFILSRASISSVEHYFTRRLAVKLIVTTPEPVIVSKVKSSELLRWMEAN